MMRKLANITPKHNKGKNYRPVSIISIILKRVMNGLLEINKLISIEQHGLVTSKACVTNLLECQDLTTISLHELKELGMLYNDFMKAFNEFSYRKLIHKLRAYGFGERLIDRVGSFLRDRKQRVFL